MGSENKGKLNILNRYMSISTMFTTIKTRKMQFSDPSRWKDRNDTEILDLYKQNKLLDSLYVLCFSQESETVSYWADYADNYRGCCVQFDKESLLNSIKDLNLIFSREVHYLSMKELNSKQIIPVKDLPFIKRWPYRAENEYRIVTVDGSEPNPSIPICMNWIKKVTIGPNIPDHEFKVIKSIVHELGITTVNHSRVLYYDAWVNKVKQIVR